MIYILSWTTKKQEKKLSKLLHLKLKNIHGLAQKFKDFSSLCEPCTCFETPERAK